MNTTLNTALNNKEAFMDEHVYKVLGGSGALNIAFGIISITVGLATGVLLIISGAKLLGSRKKIIF